jgi:hypothetical protein
MKRILKDLFLRLQELRWQGEEWMIACWMIDEAKVEIRVWLGQRETRSSNPYEFSEQI